MSVFETRRVDNETFVRIEGKCYHCKTQSCIKSPGPG